MLKTQPLLQELRSENIAPVESLDVVSNLFKYIYLI